jgi:hypothetical protein
VAVVTGTDISTFEGGDASIVLRPTKMAILIAPPGTAALTTIVDATDGTKLSLPGEFVSVGYLEKSDGLGLAPKIDTSASEAYGQTQPINYYITGSTFTASFTMKQTSKAVLDAYLAIDLTATSASGTTNEVKITTPDVPAVRYPNLLAIGQHKQGADAIWVAHYMPRVMITDMGEQGWKDDADMTYKVTYTALVDDTLGTARDIFIAGPGMGTAAATMGF